MFRTIKPFCANQNDIIKNFAVVMSAVIKRADCSKSATEFLVKYESYHNIQL